MSYLAGSQLGRYQIIAPLGKGGMGEVYRARDTQLDREVAVKVLADHLTARSDAIKRFEREAKAVAALSHPNILDIHDFGTDQGVLFAVTELLKGETLRARLARSPMRHEEALRVTVEITDGLAAAHSKGIIHRDLKPENIFITTDDRVKILDFGLARLRPVEIASEVTGVPTESGATEAGVVLGTVPYMSPEQLRGETVDARSDIFSLGCVLYEMLTGSNAFQKRTQPETIGAILHEDPPQLSEQIPLPLRQVISRCLQKDAAQRFSSAQELLGALRFMTRAAEMRPRTPTTRIVSWIGSSLLIIALLTVVLFSVWKGKEKPSAPSQVNEIRSIAVLPLKNLSGDPQREYFADAMTEELITTLARISSLQVISRTSVMGYKTTQKPLREIAKELNVDAIIEGSIFPAGDRVRITAQLIEASTDKHMWAQSYDRDLKDILRLQNEVARAIAQEIQIKLTPKEKAHLASAPQVNPQVYDLYLRGKYLLNKTGAEDLNQAIPLLEKAITLDPQFALAHATLGKAYRQKYFFIEPSKEWEEKAFVEIEKAIALDPNLAEAYAARGRLIWTRQNNYPHERSADDYKKAIALDPNLAEAHAYLGGIYFHVGLLEEAIQEFTTALKLDPTNSLARSNYVMILLFNQEYRQALSASEQSPGDEIWGALSLLYLGDVQKSERLMKELLQKEPERAGVMRVWDTSFIHSSYAVLLAKTGDIGGAEKQIRLAIENDRGLGHFHHSEYNIASAYALMGKTASAIEWLQKTADHGFSCYPLFERDPHLKNLRGNSDFETFLKKMKQRRDYYRSEFLAG